MPPRLAPRLKTVVVTCLALSLVAITILGVQAVGASAASDRFVYALGTCCGQGLTEGELHEADVVTGANPILRPITTKSWSWALSPNGREFAYGVWNYSTSKFEHIVVANVDGTNQRTMVPEASVSAFDPSGTKLWVIKYGANSPCGGLCTVNVDGTGLKTVVPGLDSGTPSPDGKHIVYTAITESSKRLGTSWNLFVANADGSNPQQITHFTLRTEPSTVYEGQDAWWGPNNTIAFLTLKLGVGGPWLWTVKSDGTGAGRVPNSGFPLYISWTTEGTINATLGCELVTITLSGVRTQVPVNNPTICEGGRPDEPTAVYRQLSTSYSNFDALAARFEPVLRFDTSEKWRPLNVEKFFEENRQYLCDTNTGCEHEPLANVAGLNRDRASTAYVQVAGEGDVEESYHSPYSECTSSGLLDCDSGPRSAIYYRSPGVYGGYEYIDYWFFYRANRYSGDIDFHQGDWENVTVAPSLTDGSFDYAAFSQHGTDYAYARGVLRCEESPGSTIPAAGTCSSSSDRIDDMVAYGSHANFTTPCSQEVFTDCRNNNNFLPSEFENGYDGQKRWGRAWEPAALLKMPNAGTNSWVDWPGKWGDPGSLPEGEGPASPANQSFRVECATINNEAGCETGPRTSSVHNPLGLISRDSVRVPGLSAVSCANWAGPGIAAVACNPKDLRRAVLHGDVGTNAPLNLTIVGRHSVSGGGRGIAQVAGTSGLRDGSELSVSGPVTPETKILARVYDPVSKHELLGMFQLGATPRARIAGTTKLRLRVSVHRSRKGRVSLSLGRLHAKAIVWESAETKRTDVKR